MPSTDYCPRSTNKYSKFLAVLQTLQSLGYFRLCGQNIVLTKIPENLLRLFPTEKKDKDAIGQVLVKAGEENAGVIDVGEGWGVAFKIESHNHPSAIEPFEGAATGVGGIVRDIFTMGARPVLLTNSLRFGSLESSHVKDYSAAWSVEYPTMEIVWEFLIWVEMYILMIATRVIRLVNALCAGILRHEEIQKGQPLELAIRYIMLVPGTGRDGLGVPVLLHGN